MMTTICLSENRQVGQIDTGANQPVNRQIGKKILIYANIGIMVDFHAKLWSHYYFIPPL